MKKQILCGTLLSLLTAAGAQTPYIQNFASGGSVGPIPNSSPIGVAFSGTVSDIPAGQTISGLTVGLDLSGGFNGYLYAYLDAPGGTQVALMNEPGWSPGDPLNDSGPGMAITLEDTGAVNGSIQNATGSAVLTGSYNAAGLLAGFNGLAPDGTWTLFFADEVSGGGTSTLNDWSLDISTVPEPGITGLAMMGGLMIGGVWRARRGKA